MKIKVDIDVKPEEIRTLIGLPDVQGIQDDLVQYIRGGMKKGVDTVEAVTMLRQFLPESLKTASALQQMFAKGWSKVLGDEVAEDEAAAEEKTAQKATSAKAEKAADAKPKSASKAKSKTDDD